MSVLAAVTVVPLVVYLRVQPLGGAVLGYWNGQPVNYDFFAFYKARLLLALAAVAGLGIVWRLVGRTSELRRLPFAALGAIAAFVALAAVSAWRSPFPDVATHGFPDRYEGLLVLLAYAVIFLASFEAFTPRDARRIVTWLSASALAIGFVGALQYAGIDPFRTEAGRELIVPGDAAHLAGILQFPAEARTVYSTLYHYNYVGSYAAVVLPLLAAVLASQSVRGAAGKLAGAAAGVLAFVWLVCGSRAGLVGGVCALVPLALAFRGKLRVPWRRVAIAGAALVLAIVAADLALGGRIRARAVSVAGDLRRVVSPAPARMPVPPLSVVSVSARTLRLMTPAGPLVVGHDQGNVGIRDGDGRDLQLAMQGNSGAFRLDDPKFAELEFTLGRIGGQPALVVKNQAYVLNFLLLESGIQPAMKTGRPVPAGRVEALGFAGREALGSARGFIWSRSLPLLRDTLIVGNGPDTFAMVFPQQDFPGKFQVYGTTDMLVDKAHNYYLQTALNTGVLSMLALLVLFGAYGAGAVRALTNGSPAGPPTDPAAAQAWSLAAGCLAAVAGYLVAALFNDSVVGVAPVFWALLGLGFRMNGECRAARTGERL